MRRAWTSAAVIVGALAWAGAAKAADDPSPSFGKDVKPFLNKYCMNCHSGPRARAGYSVESLTSLTRDGKKGPLVVPEKPDDSELLLTLTGKGKAMPPRKAPQPKAEEIAKVKAWVEAGAKDDPPPADDDKKKGDAGK
jgi:hypothetical protein